MNYEKTSKNDIKIGNCVVLFDSDAHAWIKHSKKAGPEKRRNRFIFTEKEAVKYCIKIFNLVNKKI